MERDAEMRGSEWDQPKAPIEYTEVNEPHVEQVGVWVDDVAEALLPWLKDFESYDDKLNFLNALGDQLTSIAIAAHAAGMVRERSKT